MREGRGRDCRLGWVKMAGREGKVGEGMRLKRG